MGKAKLDIRTVTKRRAAKVSPKLHTRAVENEPGLFVGWRKGKTRSTWSAKMHVSGFKYEYTVLPGQADDRLPEDQKEADGIHFLNYKQAVDAAKTEWVQFKRRQKDLAYAGPYSVKDALNDWLTAKETDRRKTLTRTRYTIAADIEPVLGAIVLEKLTAEQVKGWWKGLACLKPKPDTLDTPDSIRARQSTANRIQTVLKAALNHAYFNEKVTTRNAWDKLKPFKNVDAATVRHLKLDQCKALIAACAPDFALLVRAGLYTGLRYSEITGLIVADFNGTALSIRHTKAGKPRWTQLVDEAKQFFSEVCAGRDGQEVMFIHTSGRHKNEPWQHSQQRHWMLAACKKAEIPPIGFHCATRHSFASILAAKKTPMPVIAALLGHANGDTRMVQKHYAHLDDDYVSETLKQNLPSFL